jgi:hypothetical protein
MARKTVLLEERKNLHRTRSERRNKNRLFGGGTTRRLSFGGKGKICFELVKFFPMTLASANQSLPRVLFFFFLLMNLPRSFNLREEKFI